MKKTKEIMIVAGVFLVIGFGLGLWAEKPSNNPCSEKLTFCQLALNESLNLNRECVTGFYELASVTYNFTDSEKAIFKYLLNDTEEKHE